MHALPTAMLTLTSPAWLLGLAAAAGVPLAAHLLSKVRYRAVAFPATRFVEQAVVETTQLNRPRHLLLMLLRIAALACVVLAFARPQWRGSAAPPAQADGETLVIILDSSASMQRTRRGASLFDQARAQALAALDTLDPARDSAAVILADRSPRLLLPEPTANRALLRDRLDQAACTYETADLAGAVALAHRLLQEDGRAGRILLLTDGQRGNRPDGGLATLAPGVPITEQRVGDDAPANTAVRLMDLSPYPPVLGGDLTLDVELRHFGDTTQQVTLHAEGAGGRASTSLTLRPGAAATQSLTLTPTLPGVQPVRVWIEPGDVFTLDDETGVVIEAASARRVSLYTDADTEGDTTASRIALALAPGGDAASAVRVNLADLGTLDLFDAAHTPPGGCWVLTGLRRVPDGLGVAMRRHLEAGGGVVWFIDTPAGRRAAEGLEAAPLRFTGEPGGDGVVAAVRFDHPALSVFEGPARASLVGQRLAGVAPARAADHADVLMRAADGRPILAMARVGRGRLFMVNADPAPTRTDFTAQPAFVAWVSELVAYAAPGPAPPAPRYPGDPLPQALRNTHSIVTPAPAHAATGSADRVTAPGLYLGLDVRGDSAAGLYAQLDPTESDFAQAPLDAPTRVVNTARGGVQPDTSAAGGRPRELWPACIVAALLLVGFESLALAHYARRERGA